MSNRLKKLFEPTNVTTDLEPFEYIKQVTGNFNNIGGRATLMGTIYNYDKEGRPLNADLNYNWKTFIINDKPYTIIKKGWVIKIVQADTNWLGFKQPNPYFVVDNTPDYVIEYRKQISNEAK